MDVCGNTSLKGAIYASLDSNSKTRMENIITNRSFVELNEQDSFQDDFINALFIPHLKLDFTRVNVNPTS
ncbi:MAG: ASKHA domain-containing protein [Opitutaceae bacterium]|nr:ASKHA domain-containing protein [Opitutaceae bacterium]